MTLPAALYELRRAVATLAATLVLGAPLACTSETQVNLLEPLSTAASSSGSDTGSSDGSASPDADSKDAAATLDAAPESQHLIHRYSFDGDGIAVLDSVGNADGELRGGATLDGYGHVTLDGQDDYVNLPNGLISGLTDATLVAWLAWSGGPCWQRVFDFGSTDAGEDMVGNATSSVFATTLACPGNGPSTAFGTTGIEASVDSNMPFPQLENQPIAVVLDVTNAKLHLYAAGVLVGTDALAHPLSEISDVNDWLGQSQWSQDVHLRGTYDEFRIYDIALSPAQLAAVDQAGPDVVTP
ncbi:MAG TPA: LamG domain-containing protein [Polyangiaceae bacterium]|nr:LamG domain-containing protein [Polyangiaceae bacterium]